MADYIEIRTIIENNFSSRLSLHKNSQDVYLDGNLFDIAKFREEVYLKHHIVIDNDKYIYELTYQRASQNLFSPLEDYLNQCVSGYPKVDYREVFKYINENVLHIDANSLEAIYLPKMLVAAVARVFNPGYQHDTVLILKGGQGFYKTSFFRELAGREYFTTLNLQNYNADELMVCHSKWIVELGECEDTIKPHSMSKLKAFITKESDTFRKPYAKHPITVPRQFILVGTTNKDQFLQDTTGNRRFWVIEVNQKINIDWIKQNRSLVWAASVLAYRDNYCTYLNDTEQQLSNSINASNFQVEDMWTQIISNWALSQTQPFTLSDVLTKALNKEPKTWKRSDEARVISILQSLGFQKPEKATRVNNKSGKYYYPITTALAKVTH